jgi:hypothetical protein
MIARFTRSGVLAVAALLPLVSSAASSPVEDHAQGAYVVSEVAGNASCREATPAEAEILRRRPAVPMTVFGERRGGLRTNAEGQPGLNIILRGTDQLNANVEAKEAFERAAAIWESRIADPITVYVDVDFGPKRFGEEWSDANIIASASTPSWLYGLDPEGNEDNPPFYPIFRQLMGARANSDLEASVYNSLPQAKIPTDVGDMTVIGGGSIVLRLFGLSDFPPTADPEERAPSIGFNSAFQYDFNPDDGISLNRKDFVGVVVHEIGHMLGFSSRVGVKEINAAAYPAPAILDLFRFQPGVSLATFATAPRILTTGVSGVSSTLDHVFFAGALEHGLSTGNGRGENGDKQQSSHWKDDSQTGTYVGIMDPTIASQKRVDLTRFDLEAFGILGYNMVSPGCTELEPNDRADDASELAYETPCSGVTGLTESAGVNFKASDGSTAWVQDLFKVTLPSQAKLNVSLTFTTETADLNVFLLRFDGTTPTVLASSLTQAKTEQFETATLPAGTYFVGVSSAKSTSPYTVTATPIGLVPPPPPAPIAPSSLIATPASSSSIRLSWADNAGNEDQYVIEQLNVVQVLPITPDGDFIEVATLPANSTSYEVTGLAADSTYTFRLRARNAGGDSGFSANASAKTLVAPGLCVASDTTVCMLDGRFRVTVDYLNQFANPPQPGKLLAARLLPGTQNPDTATFGFSSPQAIEVVVRIQDTRPFGLSRFDVYYGGMTDVEYTVTVQDMETGTTRLYRNPPGKVGADVDRVSFPTNGASTAMYSLVNSTSSTRAPIVGASIAPRACVPGANSVCLLSDRFEVKVDFLNQFANPPAPGTMLGAKLVAGVQNPDTATFGFGSAQAIESVVRIQDTRPFGLNRFDVYVGGMSDVEYTVTVTDTQTGNVRQYRNPPGAVGGIVDRASFTAN